MKKSLISAIKKLLIKLGAEEIEGNNLVEVIDSGADAIEGQPGGGGSAYIVHRVQEANGITRLDKTWNEIKTALATNIVLTVQSVGDSETNIEIVYSAYRSEVEEGGLTSFRYKVLSGTPTPNGGSTPWIANDKNSYPVSNK